MRVGGRTLALCAVLAIVALSSCGGGADGGNTVAVLDNSFAPRTVTIQVGGGVLWTWNGNAPHNVVFAPASGIDGSPVLNTPAQFEVRFNNPGTYPYECTLHGGMTGTVIVK